MSEFVKIGSKEQLPPMGEAREFVCAGKTICVANRNGEYSALDNVCIHRGGPLGQGVVEGDKLICPWHGWQYDPKTGESAHNPSVKVAVYPMKLVGDNVLLEI